MLESQTEREYPCRKTVLPLFEYYKIFKKILKIGEEYPLLIDNEQIAQFLMEYLDSLISVFDQYEFVLPVFHHWFENLFIVDKKIEISQDFRDEWKDTFDGIRHHFSELSELEYSEWEH